MRVSTWKSSTRMAGRCLPYGSKVPNDRTRRLIQKHCSSAQGDAAPRFHRRSHRVRFCADAERLRRVRSLGGSCQRGCARFWSGKGCRRPIFSPSLEGPTASR